MEQAAKNYEWVTTEKDEEAQKIILELPQIRKRFEDYLKSPEFSLNRLKVGDVLPEFDDILKISEHNDFYVRVLYISLMIISAGVIFGYVEKYGIGLQMNPILILCLLILAISFSKINNHLVNRNLFHADPDYEIMSNQKLVELNEILEPEIEILSEKLFKPMINQIIELLKKDVETLSILVNASESDNERYKLAFSLGVHKITNQAQYLKSIQILDKTQFRALRGAIKLVIADISLLYDTFMKNYAALNLRTNQNLPHNYY